MLSFAIEAGSLSTGSMKMSYVGVCLVQPGLFLTTGSARRSYVDVFGVCLSASGLLAPTLR